MPIHHKRPRLQAIDIARAIALIGMIIYHFSWDLSYFDYLTPGSASEGGLRLLARIVASSFLFLAGFSLYLAHSRAIRWHAFWKRFILIVAAALLISIVTYILLPHEFIYFGILHQVALTSLVGLIFLRTPLTLNIFVAVIVLIAPHYIQNITHPALLWLGLDVNPPTSFDYVPFFPWFAAGLLGLTLARLLDRFHALTILRHDIRPQWLNHSLQWAGRHSLTVYLIHQPILLGLLFIFSFFCPPSYDGWRQIEEQQCRVVADPSQSAIIETFCRCAFDKLEAQNLFIDYIKGKIDVNDNRIIDIQSSCIQEASGHSSTPR